MDKTTRGVRSDDANPNSNRDKLRNFLLDHLEGFAPIGGTGSAPALPKFDLYPQDYLAFAEAELKSFALDTANEGRLINCVTHLKRAVDCQMDMFLHAFNLYKLFRDRNLKFRKKLDFLESAAIISSRSLRRLNSLRNTVEHDFVSPRVDDIEAYYDIVAATVVLLQRVVALSIFFVQDFEVHDSRGNSVGSFSIEYDYKRVGIDASWQVPEEKLQIHSSAKGCIEEFTFFLRVWVLLGLFETFASTRFIAAQMAES